MTHATRAASIFYLYGTFVLLAFSNAAANQVKIKFPPLKTYDINTQQCSFNIRAEDGGDVVTDGPSNSAHSAFYARKNAKGGGLTFKFKCVAQNARTYCPDDWMKRHEQFTPDPSKIMKTRQHDGFHPLYYSLAFAKNFIGTSEPRQRYFAFCLGNENNALEGFGFIGNDQKDEIEKTLNLLKTIKLQ